MKALVAHSAESVGGVATITTTLFDLIAAIQAEVGIEAEEVVVPTVVRLLHSGHVKILGEMGRFHGPRN